MIPPDVAELLRTLDAPFFAALAPPAPTDSALASDLRPPLAMVDRLGAPRSLADARRTGCARVLHAVPAEHVATMRATVERLVAAGVPPVFAYAYQTFWSASDAVARAVALFAGESPHGVSRLDDVWAFHVPVGAGNRGWAPHRGVYDPRYSPSGAPVTVNTWLALAPATRDNACMHLVELDADPHVTVDPWKLPDASRGAPWECAAGDVLVWDAAVAHWGGESSVAARAPRMSATYSYFMGRSDVSADVHEHAGLDARLAVVARMIELYARQEPQFPAAYVGWARVFLDLYAGLAGGGRVGA